MNETNTVGKEIKMIDEKINQIKSIVKINKSKSEINNEEKQINELERKKRDLIIRLISDQMKELETMEENRIRFLEKELSEIFGGEVLITRNDYVFEIFQKRFKMYDVNLTDISITGFTNLALKLDSLAVEAFVSGVKTGMNFQLVKLASDNKLPLEEITGDTPF